MPRFLFTGFAVNLLVVFMLGNFMVKVPPTNVTKIILVFLVYIVITLFIANSSFLKLYLDTKKSPLPQMEYKKIFRKKLKRSALLTLLVVALPLVIKIYIFD
jgi:hypothetical protein